MKISHCLWLSMCISALCHGQTQLDSLKKLVSDARAENYNIDAAYHLFQIGHYFDKANQFDSALVYYHQVLKSNPRAIDSASVLNGIGVVYSNLGLPDRSIPYYRQAIALYERLNDTTSAVTTGINLAIIYKDIGLYDDALEISFNTLSKLEKQKPDRPLASSYNTIGTVYTRIQDYDKAYEYYRKALDVRLYLNYEQGIGQSYNNIGELFIEMAKYDSALKNLSKAAEVRRSINDTRGLGRTLTLIGNTLVRSGKPVEAKAELTQALAINRTSHDNIGEIATLNTLATAHLATHELKAAEESLKIARTLIDQGNIKEHLRTNLELQAKVYRAVNDRSKLVSVLDELMIVKDSLLNADKLESMLALEVKYETEKKEQEILLLHQQGQIDRSELDKNKTQIYALSVVLVLVLVIAALVYWLYRETRKVKLSTELHMKELHHRVKNNLQILSSIFTIQASMLEDKKAQEVIKSTEGRVNAMALVHKRLYNSEIETEFDLKDYVNELVHSILYSYGFDENRLQPDLMIADIRISVDRAIRVLLILNELVTNSLKYAYDDLQLPVLKVQITKNENSMLLEVADNGKNHLSADALKNSSSFGLKMVKSLVQELHGQMDVRAENGTAFLITIPQ